MTTIKLNNKYQIRYDGAQYMPDYFQAGGELLTKGIAKGHVTKDKWVHSGKYHGNIQSALRWCVDHEMSELNDVGLPGFLAEYKRVTEEFKLIIEGAGHGA